MNQNFLNTYLFKKSISDKIRNCSIEISLKIPTCMCRGIYSAIQPENPPRIPPELLA